jgi:hypothetical protein
VHGLCAFLYVPLYVPIRSGRPPHISVYGHLASGVSGKPSRQKGRSYTITLMSGGLLSKAVVRPYTSRATLTLLLVICYTFLYVPYTLHIRSPFEMKESCQEVYVPARSVQPSRYRCALLYVPIRSVYVLYTFPITKHRILSTVIRSYTFRATPPAILAKCGAKLYVPIRSNHVPIHSVEALLQMCPTNIRSYTFRATPPALFAKCAAKLYVPIRSNHVPIRSLEALLQMCPKVIRSYTFLRNTKP